MTPKILVSSCLLGRPVRYDGGDKALEDTHLQAWQADGRIVPICPEIAGGLSTPRDPAEIEPGKTAQDVLGGIARVLTVSGEDVTEPFVRGARLGLEHAREHGCSFALLTDGSPSCGSSVIYSGHHIGQRIPGRGLLAALLLDAGIRVFAPHQIDALADAVAAAPCDAASDTPLAWDKPGNTP